MNQQEGQRIFAIVFDKGDEMIASLQNEGLSH